MDFNLILARRNKTTVKGDQCRAVARPNRKFVCLEGEGSAFIGDKRFDFAENDVLVVPSWTTHQFRVPRDTILFSFSDRPVQQALGLWREEKLS